MARPRDSPHLHNDFISVSQASREYPVSRRSWWTWIQQGRITAYRPFQRKVLLRRSEIEKFLTAKRVNTDLDAIVEETLQELSKSEK
jgi:excisionase family DNA binding protein